MYISFISEKYKVIYVTLLIGYFSPVTHICEKVNNICHIVVWGMWYQGGNTIIVQEFYQKLIAYFQIMYRILYFHQILQIYSLFGLLAELRFK